MTPEFRTDEERLLWLLGGKARVQAVSTAAALGVADRLCDGPRSTAALAEVLGCDADALRPILRYCAGLGYLDSPHPDHWALTGPGQLLRSDRLGPLAAFAGSPEQWDPWSRLRDAVHGGPPAFARAIGQGLYPFLAGNPVAAARYDAAIDCFTEAEAAALCSKHDFAAYRTAVDVGGGRGRLLAAVLEHWPHLRGTLFDLPHVAAAARATLQQRCGDRATAVGGDFFAAIPAADVLLVKHVLHNWADEDAMRLLRNCRDALAADGSVLVVETLLAPDHRPDLAATLDLEMQVLTGGRERRRPELRRLFSAAGLSLVASTELVAGSWLLVGRPAAR